MRFAYQSINWQPFLIGIALALRLQPGRLYAFVASQSFCVLLVSLVTLFVPALGAYHFYHASLASMPYLTFGDMDTMAAPILALRAGDLTALGSGAALVQFPPTIPPRAFSTRGRPGRRRCAIPCCC